MSTPMEIYKDIAHRLAGVDPSDRDAVVHFFDVTIYSFPETTRLAIADALLSGDTTGLQAQLSSPTST